MASSTHGIQGLPQEVFHIILDYLGNNKAILRSCSLVCHTWLQAARPRLFSIVSLYACERRLFEFLEFLDTHPDIAGYVRSLMLHRPMDEHCSTEDASLNTSESLTPQTLVTTTRRLPRLRECQLYFVHIVPYRPPDATNAEITLHDAESAIELDVFHMFGSPHQEIGPFLDVLSHFHINRLELELVTFLQDPMAIGLPPPNHRPIHVRDLWTDLETADDAPLAILSALAPVLRPGTLHAFHCTWREWNGCAAIGSFLRTVGHTITELTLNMSVASWVEDMGGAIQRDSWERLSLASCANLRTFRTSMPLPMACPLLDVPDVKRRVASYRNLFALLPRTVHTVIASISTTTLVPGLPPLAGGRTTRLAAQGQVPVNFHEIEEALLDLPQLRRVVIAIRSAQSARQGAPTVSKAFPALLARGVLEVRSGSVPNPRWPMVR